jgi:GAF domain-containing protein
VGSPDNGTRGSNIEQARMNDHQSTILAKIADICRNSRGVDELLYGIVQVLLDHVADAVWIDLVKDDGSIEGTIMRHRNLRKQAAFEELRKTNPLPPTAPYGYPRVIKTGKSQFISGVTTRVLERLLPGADGADFVDVSSIRSFICAPLVSRGRTLGALTVAQSDHTNAFTSDVLLHMEAIADEVAKCLDDHLEANVKA